MFFSSPSPRSGGPVRFGGHAPDRGFAREHRDGLLRGLLFAAALALPLGLTVAFAPAEGAGSGSPPMHAGVSHRLAP